jgi:type I restriction enzyme S subunit
VSSTSIECELYYPEFATEWLRYPLYDLAVWINGMAFRDINFTPVGTPVVKIAEIKNGVSGQTKFTQSTYDAKFFLKNGDMLFCWSGQPETSIDTYWWRGGNGWLNQHIFKVLPNQGIVHRDFFYQLLRYMRPTFVQIARNKQTTGLGHVTKADLQRLVVALPPIDEQRGIAATLGALDDKIESNRRSQVTGEKLIRSLVTAALERSTGEVGVLRDYCNLIKEPARIGALTADLHYIAFEHMPRGSIFLDNWGNAEGLGSDKSYFQVGDILFGKLRPYFKKVGIAPVDGVCSTDILVLRPIRKADTALVAVVASSDPLIDSLSAAATGTRMPRASWKDLASWPVPEMTTLERDELADQVAPLVERLTAMTHETKRLQLLRDTLLPELLSGRIRVPEAHETVQEVIA